MYKTRENVRDKFLSAKQTEALRCGGAVVFGSSDFMIAL